jgi:hypothetical protein
MKRKKSSNYNTKTGRKPPLNFNESMKKHTFAAAALSVILLATSCKKNDVQSPTAAGTTTTDAVASSWKTVSNWSKESAEGYAVYSSNIQDSAITASVAADGLVLVYKNGTSGAIALPAEEKATGKSYFWYYQVSEGSLLINADAYGSATSPAGQTIKYYVLSADQLSSLEAKGYSKAELMKLSYETASAILK